MFSLQHYVKFFLLLSGVVDFSRGIEGGAERKGFSKHTHNSPVAERADEVKADGCIYHKDMLLIDGGIKTSRDHPCCCAGIGASTHIYHAALYSHPEHLTPL